MTNSEDAAGELQQGPGPHPVGARAQRVSA